MVPTYTPRTFKATASLRRNHSRIPAKRWRLVMSMDRHDLIGTPFEITSGSKIYFENRPAPDGQRFYWIVPYTPAIQPGFFPSTEEHIELPDNVYVANVQNHNRVRFYNGLAWFRHMEGYPDCRVELEQNGWLKIFYPPRLQLAKPTKGITEELLHGKDATL